MKRHTLRLLALSSETYPPDRVDEAVLFGEELVVRGHTIDWILQSNDACRKAYTTVWGGGRVFVGATDVGTSMLRRLRRHMLDIWNDVSLFRLLAMGNYDVVRVRNKIVAGVLALIAARRTHTCFVYWLSFPIVEFYLLGARDGSARYRRLWRLRGLLSKLVLYRIVLPNADHIFVQSEQMRREVARHGIRLDAMTVVPMGVKLAATSASPVSRRTVIPTGESCILYLGTLAKTRRLDFLVRVLANLHRSVPCAKLYFVGAGDDPSDAQLIVKEADRLNVSKEIVLVGKLPRLQALQYVREADVCVSPLCPSPILNVASPTKLVEYMAMGKAVVASDHPEQRLVIERSGAGYCVPHVEEEFARAIGKLLAAPDEARAMGERGRLYVKEQRVYETIAERVEDQLLRVVVKVRG